MNQSINECKTKGDRNPQAVGQCQKPQHFFPQRHHSFWIFFVSSTNKSTKANGVVRVQRQHCSRRRQSHRTTSTTQTNNVCVVSSCHSWTHENVNTTKFGLVESHSPVGLSFGTTHGGRDARVGGPVLQGIVSRQTMCGLAMQCVPLGGVFIQTLFLPDKESQQIRHRLLCL